MTRVHRGAERRDWEGALLSFCETRASKREPARFSGSWLWGIGAGFDKRGWTVSGQLMATGGVSVIEGDSQR